MDRRTRLIGLSALAAVVFGGFILSVVSPLLEQARRQRLSDEKVVSNLTAAGGMAKDDAERITVLSRQCFQGTPLGEEERQFLLAYIDRSQTAESPGLRLTLAYSVLRDDARHSKPPYSREVVDRMRQILSDPAYTRLQTNVRGALWVLGNTKDSTFTDEIRVWTKDPRPEVRTDAQQALKRTGGHS